MTSYVNALKAFQDTLERLDLPAERLADPAVQEILTDVPTRAETVALKGFTEPVGFLRLLSTASNLEREAANTW